MEEKTLMNSRYISYTTRGVRQIKGLNGKDLEEYVENRIEKSIERAQNMFETNECGNYFAKGKDKDILNMLFVNRKF